MAETDDPRLTAIALGELEPEALEQLDEHAHAELAAIEQTVDLVRELYARPPEEPRAPEERIRRRVWPWLAAAAAVLLAIAAGLAMAPDPPMAKLWLPDAEYEPEPLPTMAERDPAP